MSKAINQFSYFLQILMAYLSSKLKSEHLLVNSIINQVSNKKILRLICCVHFCAMNVLLGQVYVTCNVSTKRCWQYLILPSIVLTAVPKFYVSTSTSK